MYFLILQKKIKGFCSIYVKAHNLEKKPGQKLRLRQNVGSIFLLRGCVTIITVKEKLKGTVQRKLRGVKSGING
jgi:hypothetical protein